jgi:hypothetical protein
VIKRPSIDYEQRVAEAQTFAEVNYGVESTPFRILLASLLPTPGHFPCWIVCRSRPGTFWGHFAPIQFKYTQLPLIGLNHLRFTRPRHANMLIGEMMSNRNLPRVLNDYYTEPPPEPKLPPQHQLKRLKSECLTVNFPINSLTQPPPTAADDLHWMVRACVNPEHRKTLPKPLSRVPEMLIYCATLMQRLNPVYVDGQALMRNLLILPAQLAVLEGNETVSARNWEDVNRAMLESISTYKLKVVKAMVEAGEYVDLGYLTGVTGVERRFLLRVCGELTEAGVVEQKRRSKGFDGRMSWVRVRKEGIGVDLQRWIEGELKWW